MRGDWRITCEAWNVVTWEEDAKTRNFPLKSWVALAFPCAAHVTELGTCCTCFGPQSPATSQPITIIIAHHIPTATMSAPFIPNLAVPVICHSASIVNSFTGNALIQLAAGKVNLDGSEGWQLARCRSSEMLTKKKPRHNRNRSDCGMMKPRVSSNASTTSS